MKHSFLKGSIAAALVGASVSASAWWVAPMQVTAEQQQAWAEQQQAVWQQHVAQQQQMAQKMAEQQQELAKLYWADPWAYAEKRAELATQWHQQQMDAMMPAPAFNHVTSSSVPAPQFERPEAPFDREALRQKVEEQRAATEAYQKTLREQIEAQRKAVDKQRTVARKTLPDLGIQRDI